MKNKCEFCDGTGDGVAYGTICPVCRGTGMCDILKHLEKAAEDFVREKANPEFFLYNYRFELAAIPHILKSIPGCTKDMVIAGWLYWFPYSLDCTSDEIYLRFGRRVQRLLSQIYIKDFASEGLDVYTRYKVKVESRLEKASWEAKAVELVGLGVTLRVMVDNEVPGVEMYQRGRRSHVNLLVRGIPMDVSKIEKEIKKYM
jgi:hypothetical protein